MAWPLPAEPQPSDGQANALARDLDPMHLLQLLPQEWSGPNRGVIAQVPGIGVDDLGDQRVDDPQGRGRTAWAGSIRQTRADIEPLALQVASRPIVDRLAADMEQFGDLVRRLPLIEPEHSLGAATFLRRGGMEHEGLQLDALSSAEHDRSHGGYPSLFAGASTAILSSSKIHSADRSHRKSRLLQPFGVGH